MGMEPNSLGDWIKTYGGMGLPHALTFSGLFQTGYKTYFGQFDEARRIGYEFAAAMRRDCFLMSLIDERKENVGALNWHLEVEDAQDPLQIQVRDHLDATIRSVFDHRRIFWELLDALWYGRMGVQFKWDWIWRSGIKTLTVREFEPVNGDSLRFQFDGTPYVVVYAGREIPGAAEIVSTPLGGRGVLLRGSWRQRFCIHKHETFAGDYFDIEKAEAIHGLGIRDVVAWTVFMHQEWLAKVSDFLDRVGLGISLFYYQEGNAAAQAEAESAAKEQSGRVNITLPMGKDGRKITGVERVEVPLSGAEVLLKMVDALELKLERFIVGQDSSSRSSSGDGLGNEASAEFKQSTQEKRTARDADRLEESLTGNCYHPGLIWMMQRWTFPTTVPEQGGFRVRFKFDVTTAASEKRLSGAKTAWEMGASVKEAEVLEFAGLSQATGNDKVLAGKPAPAAPPGFVGAPGTNGAAKPGSNGDGHKEPTGLDLKRQEPPPAAGNGPPDDPMERLEWEHNRNRFRDEDQADIKVPAQMMTFAELLRYGKDAAGHEHAPAGNEHGGEFVEQPGGGSASASASAEKANKQGKKYGKSKAKVRTLFATKLDGKDGADYEKATKKMIEKLLGKGVSFEDVASAVGAPDDAEVMLMIQDGGRLQVTVTINHPAFRQPCIRVIKHQGPGGKAYVENKIIDIKPEYQGQGLGSQIFERQVEQMQEIGGFSHIRCHAARQDARGEERFNGYYTWPVLGYNSWFENEAADGDPAAEGTYEAIKELFPGVESVMELTATPEGRGWWKKNGFDLFHCEFSLKENSASLARLEAYKAERAARPPKAKV
jgi:GNAT superfamily N-acetyltransferase